MLQAARWALKPAADAAAWRSLRAALPARLAWSWRRCPAESVCWEKAGTEFTAEVVGSLARLPKRSIEVARRAAPVTLPSCRERGGPESSPRRPRCCQRGLPCTQGRRSPRQPARPCRPVVRWPARSSAEGVALLAEFTKDSDEDVRVAAPQALPSCCDNGVLQLNAYAMELLAKFGKGPGTATRHASRGALLSCCRSGGLELATWGLELLAGRVTNSGAMARRRRRRRLSVGDGSRRSFPCQALRSGVAAGVAGRA